MGCDIGPEFLLTVVHYKTLKNKLNLILQLCYLAATVPSLGPNVTSEDGSTHIGDILYFSIVQ